MQVRTYKLVKAVTQLAAVAAGIYAMALDSDPFLTFVLIAIIISGPEVLELMLTNVEAPAQEEREGES